MPEIVRPWWAKILLFKLIIILVVLSVSLFDLPSVRISAAALIKKIKPMQTSTELPQYSIWHAQDYVAINRIFEQAKTPFDPEVIKAVAWCESEWKHYDSDGYTKVGENTKVTYKKVRHARRKKRRIVTRTYDLGLMQINDNADCLNPDYWDYTRIQSDPEYNLHAGIAVLKMKYAYVQYLKQKKNWKRIERRYRLKGHSDLEITLKAYNGFQRSWSYVERVQTVMREKPWEHEIVRQMEAQGKLQCDALAYVGERAADSTIASETTGVLEVGSETLPEFPAFCLEMVAR